MNTRSFFSTLRNIAVTVVGLLCFSIAGVGQYTLSGDNYTISNQKSQGDLYCWKVNLSSDVQEWKTLGINSGSVQIKSFGAPLKSSWGSSTQFYLSESGTFCVIYNAKDGSISAQPWYDGIQDDIFPVPDPNQSSFDYNFTKTYYYVGPTGSSSDVTNLNNWNTNPNGTGSKPTNFTTARCKYVINKEDVLLPSDKKWTVSGSQTKIVVGDGVTDASFVVAGTMKYANGVDVSNKATLDLASATLPTFGKFDEGSTVKYSAKAKQEIKTSRVYSNLVIEKDGIIVFPEGVVSISGEFTPIKAKYEITGSTIKYVGTNQTVTTFNYYNLDLGNGTRTYATNGTIGIAGSFTPSTGTTNVDGSTVEFNGDMQTIPASQYYNLTFNNSTQSKLDGKVDVYNILFFNQGVVTNSATTNFIEVFNTDAGAVKANAGSFTKTALKRHIAANLSNSLESYLFPVGYNLDYYPMTIDNITTGTGDVTVQVSYNKSGVWNVSYKGNYTKGSVSLTSPNLGNNNAIKGGNTNLYGTVAGSSIIKSDLSKEASYSLWSRPVNSVVYKYVSGDPTLLSSWKKDGNGASPTSFNINDATWSIDKAATIPAGKVLNIGGSNSKLEVTTDNGNLSCYGDINVSGSFGLNDKAKISVYDGANINVDGNFSHTGANFSTLVLKPEATLSLNSGANFEKITVTNGGNINVDGDLTIGSRATIINNGTINCKNSDVYVDGGTLTNNANGTVYVDNGSFTEKQSAWGRNTYVTNNGKMVLTNTSVCLYGGDVRDYRPSFINAKGGVITVDNTNSGGKDFKCVNRAIFGPDELDFQDGSSLVVKGCNLDFNIYPRSGGSSKIEGNVSVVDGDFIVSSAGGGCTFEFGKNSEVYLYDTNNNGDGMLKVDGGGGDCQVDVNGTLYVEGLSYKSGGGGNAMNVNDGATTFIGNLGADIEGDRWTTQINVKSGSVTYYCGNITTGADHIGRIETGGTLNYAQEYYVTDPKDEIDFEGNGLVQAVYITAEECVAAYKDTVANLLPVEMTLSYGVCTEKNIELHWQTASETGNEVFEVFRSFDGVNFEEIGSLLGAGTTTDVQNYVYYDTDEDKTGVVYYKIRQVDFDGKTKDSKIIAVQTCGKNAKFSVTEEDVFVHFEHPEVPSYVVITTLSGKIVYSKTFTNVEIARIAVPKTKGMYIISVIDNKQITSEKFIR